MEPEEQALPDDVGVPRHHHRWHPVAERRPRQQPQRVRLMQVHHVGATRQRRTHRPDLVDNVDAVAFFLDHARHPAHLALDAAEPRELRFLDLSIHDLNYTPIGYTWQA